MGYRNGNCTTHRLGVLAESASRSRKREQEKGTRSRKRGRSSLLAVGEQEKATQLIIGSRFTGGIMPGCHAVLEFALLGFISTF